MRALSAPKSVEGEDVVSIVILIVSVLSGLGALWMILSYALVPSLRTFRHQLTLGLGISDFAMALNFTLSACLNLSGQKIWSEPLHDFCSANGFLTQVFVIQTDYWILNIAVCTYSILANHKSLYAWMQDHSVIIFIWPWVLSVTWAVLGIVLVGYENIGGFCWFGSDRTRLLVNFLPRWIIIFVIIALYLRLSYILLRVRKKLNSSSEDTTMMLSESYEIFHMADSQRKISQTTRDINPVGSQSVTSNTQQGGQTSKLRKVAIRMMMYPVLYMLVWTAPTAIRIYQETTGKSTPLVINCLDKASIVIQGLVDAIIYGLNERSWNEWKRQICTQMRRLSS